MKKIIDWADYTKYDCFKDRENEERDRAIISFFGCWHELGDRPKWNEFSKCKKCQGNMTFGNPNLSTPNGYFWLLDHLKQDVAMFEDFINYASVYVPEDPTKVLPSPDEFADLVYGYLAKMVDDAIKVTEGAHP